MDLIFEKKRLRKAISERKAALTPEFARSAGLRAARFILESPEFRLAARVALFAALPDEPCTRPLFDAVRRAGKQALLPRVQGASVLDFAVVDGWEELRTGPRGLSEPAQDRPRVSPDAGDLVVTPGVAFDRHGGRLGRGGGYYDRFFDVKAATGRGPALFGLGFGFQLVERVPCGPLDRRLDALVNEDSIIRVHSRDRVGAVGRAIEAEGRRRG